MAESLGDDVRLAVMQFTFTRSELVPKSFGIRGEKAFQDGDETQRVPGEQVIDQTPEVGILPFVGDLTEAGYELVNAFSRRQSNNSGSYFKANFEFVQKEHAQVSEFFLKQREAAMADLTKLVTEAMWQTRAYLNLFFSRGVPVEGVSSVFINLAKRVPLVDAKGPLLRWQRDERGEKVGTAPIPIAPKRFLRVRDCGISIVEE